jgi:hypothetical protein
MKRSESQILLAKIAAYDRRTIGDADNAAWTEVMTNSDVPLSDALVAVAAHFGASHDYLMPIHIIERVKAIRRERLTRAGTPPTPGGLEYADEKAWRQLWCAAVKDGDVDPEGTANRAMKITPAPLEENRARVRAIEALARSKSIPGENVA